MTNLSVIIVSYNSNDVLEKCLKSLQKSTLENFETIVVDNASKDNPKDLVGKFNGVIFIRNDENLGFSKANNIGIKIAKGNYILFLNPDMEVYPDTLSYMRGFMEKNKDVGAATCKVVLKTGKMDDSCHRGFPTPWNSFCHFSGLTKLFPKSKLFAGYNLGYLDLSKKHEIDSLAGSFFFTRGNAGKEVGWWDEDFFFYGEDLDFCYELKQKGWKIYYVPDVLALHYKGVSGGIKNISNDISTADLETKKRATKERFRAMEIFYNKHYKNKYPGILTWMVLSAIKIKYWFSLRSL